MNMARPFYKRNAMAKRADSKGKGEDSFAQNDEILLGILTAVEQNANVSQRHISSELGVALGLANAYLRRCVRKGLIKIQQVPRRRYLYYLTPHGFTEKARLTGQYLSASFNFFRRARDQMSGLIVDCGNKGMRRIALAGVSDLAEIAILCAQEQGVELIGIVDPDYRGTQFFGLNVRKTLGEFGRVDAIIVTHLAAPGDVYKSLVSEAGADRVLAPRLLRLGELAKKPVPIEAAE
jgi:DNA-binding MarR family transcriptional regulator